MRSNLYSGLVTKGIAVIGDVSGDKNNHVFLEEVTLPFKLPTHMYAAMLAIWHLRPILQKRFPLHKGKERDYVRYLAWCVFEGRSQYAILRSITAWDTALMQLFPLKKLRDDRWDGCFSVGLFLYGVARYRYTFGALLNSSIARHRVARDYFRGGRHQRKQPCLAKWQIECLGERFTHSADFVDVLRIPSKDTNKTHDKLADEFGIEDLFIKKLDVSVGLEDEISCCDGTNNNIFMPEFHSLVHFRLPNRLLKSYFLVIEKLRKIPDEFEQSSVTSRIRYGVRTVTKNVYPYGVNLYGYAKGELGIGEDVRLLAQALHEHAIPFCIINIRLGDNVSQMDDTVDEWVVDKPLYAINLFCMTGIEHVRLVCEQGLDVLDGRYNIGLWPWELPTWPASCEYAYNLVDEIWGISKYTAESYCNAPVPVYTMSLPVEVENVSPLGRRDFSLPPDKFLFIFSFDFNSTLTRKNPIAVVKAFQAAFPDKYGEKVGLVLKASHVSLKNKYWRQLKAMMDADKRIMFIGETIRKPELLALYKACDCYVSLHCAEGFGRSLAEALLLRKQLIATGYSGNLDFCSDDRVALVQYRLSMLRKYDYFHAEGQYWATPDVNHAAGLMREVYRRPMPLETVYDFSPKTVGLRYVARLDEIKSKLEMSSEGDVKC